jgi:hypothetical protein
MPASVVIGYGLETPENIFMEIKAYTMKNYQFKSR